MIAIKTDESGNLAFSAEGGLIIISNAEALAQTVEEYVKTMRGEMIFKTTHGIRWNLVLGNTVSAALVESFLRERINQVEGVTGVQSIDISVGGNSLFYSATIQTIYGETDVNGRI